MVESDLEGIRLVAVSGRLGSPTSSGLEAALASVLQAAGPAARVLVDLSGVDYVSSAGLRVLEQAAVDARAAGGRLVVCGLQEPVRVSFELSGAAAALHLAETVPQAVAQLKAVP